MGRIIILLFLTGCAHVPRSNILEVTKHDSVDPFEIERRKKPLGMAVPIVMPSKACIRAWYYRDL